MGELFGPRPYRCCNCGNHVCLHDDIISKAFQGRNGRAFLFSHAMNIIVGPKEDRQLMTGLHTVADISCCECREVLGWKYERAYEETQKYKEGEYFWAEVNIRSHVAPVWTKMLSARISLGLCFYQIEWLCSSKQAPLHARLPLQIEIKIFDLLRRQIWYNPISRTYARLLTMLGRCGQPEHASALFQTLSSDGLKPTADVYTSLLGAYGFNGLLDEAFRTVEDMKSIFDCKPDVYTYTILISCCCKQHRFDLIPKVLSEMTYLGIDCSIVTHNIIIDGFGKAGMLGEMENYLATMLENSNCLPDVYTMNSILWAYGNKGKIKTMEKSYNEFQLMGLEPDITTFNILIRSYGKAVMDGKIDSVMEYMERRFFSPTIVTYSILIECFGKAGSIKNMEHYFRLMKYRGIKPNSVIYCSLISAYSAAGLIEKVPAILRQIENSNVSLDTPFFNCLLSAYGKVGIVEKMEGVFFWMKQSKCRPDAITFATMIQAYNSLGMTEAVDKLEAEMLKLEECSLEVG